eukprot:SAG31_NODE_5714_length_2367_cov_1.231481_2_plen_510_part_00
MDLCVKMAWEAFHFLFRDKIADLIRSFPEDARVTDQKTQKDMGPFWSGHKKFPSVATFDPANSLHMGFMIAAANMFASMLSVHPPKHASELNDPSNRWMAQYRDPAWMTAAIDKLGGPPAAVQGKVSLEEDGTTAGDDSEKEEFAELLADLSSMGSAPKCFEPVDFEKDDDDNFHIDFITACSNLRAFNYQISPAPRDKCKMVAGNIIPAIVTTTASVTGLAMLELYKVLLKKPIEKIKWTTFDLGTNTYSIFEANPPKVNKDHVQQSRPDPVQFPDAYDEKGNLTEMYTDPSMMLGFAEWVKYHPNPHTKYDKFFVDGCSPDMTLGELKAKVEQVCGLTVSAVFAPKQKIKIDIPADAEPGSPESMYIGIYAAALFSEFLPATKKNLDEAIGPLLLEKTTRTEEKPILDPPVKLAGRRMYDDFTFDLSNADGDQLLPASVILKFVDFDFTSIKDAVAYIERATPWLDNYSMGGRIAALEAAKAAHDKKIAALEDKITSLERKLACSSQ